MNLNRRMISAAITSLLKRSETELEQVRGAFDNGHECVWITHMTASLIATILVDALMDARKVMDEEEKVDVEA